MSVTYKKFFEPVQLGTSLATLFTVDSLPATVLLRGGRVRITNTTGAAVAAELDAVPSGGSASATTQIVPTNFTVGANSWIDVDLPVMKAGDFLQGKAGSASAISVQFMGGGLFS